MKKLMKIISPFEKNKSGMEAGGFSVIVKIAMTLIIAGLFFWLVIQAIIRYA